MRPNFQKFKVFNASFINHQILTKPGQKSDQAVVKFTMNPKAPGRTVSSRVSFCMNVFINKEFRSTQNGNNQKCTASGNCRNWGHWHWKVSGLFLDTPLG
jgi:hypothetical protein